MEYFGYSAILIMGITLGLMGGGGSILTVPILVYAFDITPTVATGYSLFIVGATALFGALVSIRSSQVDFKAGLSFAVPSILGVSFSRGWLLPSVPPTIGQVGNFIITKEISIMIAFAILMIISSYSMIHHRTDRTETNLSATIRTPLIAILGLLVGCIAGIVGAGGGFLILPALFLIAKLPMRMAVGTSLFIIAAQSLFGFAGDIARGTHVDWRFLATVVLFAAFGIAIGILLSKRVDEQKIKVGFGWFILSIGAVILFQQIRII